MDPHKFIELQKQMTHNNAELHDFLQDMDSWVSESKEKKLNKTNQSTSNDLPPIRNSLLKKKKKKKDVSKSTSKKSERISAYDYRAWDKFDVDRALDEDEQNNGKQCPDESDAETDEEWEDERRRTLAEQEKDKGNLRFKEGKYAESIEHYSTAIRMDPSNAVLYSNRAIAQIKMEHHAAAEADCTTALQIDKDFVKAYYRRGLARKKLNHLEDALSDFKQVLILEPHSKIAQKEADELENELNPSGIIIPIEKSPELRSNKPLRRIKIQEVGQESLKSVTKTSTSNITGEDAIKLVSNTAVDLSSKTTIGAVNSNESGDLLPSNPPVQLTCAGDSTNTPCKSSSLNNYHPPIPKTSLQFQTDIRDLKKRHRHEELVRYVCSIPANNLKRLFSKGLESTEMSALFQGVRDGLLQDVITVEDTFQYLHTVSNLPRFRITWMFLSNAERQYAKDLINTLKSSDFPDGKLDVLTEAFS